MMPVIAWNALHMSTILRESMKVLRMRCVDGIEADAARCRELLDRSTAVATALSPYHRLRRDRGNREGVGARPAGRFANWCSSAA